MRCEKCRGVGVLSFFELSEEAQNRATMGWVFCCDLCRGAGSIGVAFVGQTSKDPDARERLLAAHRRKYDILYDVTFGGNVEEDNKDE